MLASPESTFRLQCARADWGVITFPVSRGIPLSREELDALLLGVVDACDDGAD